MLASASAERILSAASRKNTVLSVAASCSLRGGTSRVFVLPGIDALAMTAMAQVEGKCRTSPLPMDASTSLARRPIDNFAPPSKQSLTPYGRPAKWRGRGPTPHFSLGLLGGLRRQGKFFARLWL